MARKKAIDPFMTGWFIEVLSLGNRAGYEWLLVEDRYISYRSESLSAVASARGREWSHDAALETGWICQEVAEAIDKGTIQNVGIDHINKFIEKISWSGPMSRYMDSAIDERRRRSVAMNDFIW